MLKSFNFKVFKSANFIDLGILLCLIFLYMILSFIFIITTDNKQVETKIYHSIHQNQDKNSLNKSPTSSQEIQIFVEQNQNGAGNKNEITNQLSIDNSKTQQLPEIINNPPNSSENSDLFTVAEEYPSYPGGDKARMQFLRQNIKYPAEAIKKQIEGKVIINFIVEKDGSVSNAKIISSIGGGCDEEALRVIKLMPKWNPGKQSGRPVRVLFNLPITYKLKIGIRDKSL